VVQFDFYAWDERCDNACMKAWLYAERLSEQTAFTCRLVFTSLQASKLTEHDAQEVMRGAERDFPEYRWMLVNVPGSALLFGGRGREEKVSNFAQTRHPLFVRLASTVGQNLV
jgi:hypothetical protein